MRGSILILGGFVWTAACGGTAVVDEDGGGGSGNAGTGATGTGATGTGATGNTGTGATGTGGSGASGGFGGAPPVSCTAHDDCANLGMVCIFSTGTCAPACDGGFCSDCGPGSLCDGCATSSCPACADCMAACVPIQPDRCDVTDPCPVGEQCDWGSSYCQPPCAPDGSCPVGHSCVFCATGSCCGCEDCVDLCYEFDQPG